ncbi:MAG: GNAT family protein [Chloroflexota bacterium]
MTIHWETPRLILRAFEDRDQHAFAAYRSDPQVAEYQGWEAPYSLEQAGEFIADMRQVAPGTPGKWLQVAIEIKSSGALAGDVAFHLSEDSRQAMIGCTLAAASQGQGYAREAVTRLLDYLFGELKLHRVVATTDELNAASVHLLEALGLRREVHFIENLWFKGRWSSEYYYAILQEEWLSKYTDFPD